MNAVYRVRNALLALICLFFCPTGFCVPANPNPVEVKQPDGKTFQARLRGDEYFSWTETTDGYAVLKDADGYWKYANPAPDRAGFEIVAGAKVGTSDPATLKLQKHALPAPQYRKALVEKRQQAPATSSTRPTGAQIPAGAPTPSAAPQSPHGAPPKIPVSGTATIKNIVILACFADHWDSGASTVFTTAGRTLVSEYTNLFNEVPHNSDGAVGSVREYYNETSYNKLTINTVVSNWVQLPSPEAFYGNNVGGNDQNPRQMVLDAITAADAAGFDFSQGDSDGDGWVDCLTIIHSGFGEEVFGNPAACIWSHQWVLAAAVTADGKQMRTYHTEPALRGAVGGTSIIRIGVICHEMGHFFGLPDLYDYSDATWGLGSWCIMAYGSWNGGDGKRPAHFSAWPKCALGFAVPQIVHSLAPASLQRVEDNAKVHMLRDGTSNGQYFLVENRAKQGFDNDAAIYPGVLVHHIDTRSGNNDLGTWPHPLVKIEEADGNDSLGVAKGPQSESGDVWDSVADLGTGLIDVTGFATSNAMMYQSGAYSRVNNAAFYSYLRLTGFSAAGNPMTYTLATLRPTVTSMTAGPPLPGSYNVSWAACTNATKYEIQEGTSVTLNSFGDGAESDEDANVNWAFAGPVSRDAGGSQAGTYSYAMFMSDASVQSMTMRNPFKLLSGTNISFWIMSHVVATSGYLKSQISNDGGTTWQTLGTYTDLIDPFTQYTYSSATIQGLGISLNDQCILRFVADFDGNFGFGPAFPAWGVAVDSISVTGTAIPSFTNWTTLNNNVLGTSYLVSGNGNGTYGYQVRAFSNAAWQTYSPAGQVDAVPVVLSVFGLE